MKRIRLGIGAMIALGGWLSTNANGAVLYTENYPNGSTTAQATLTSVGWSAYLGAAAANQSANINAATISTGLRTRPAVTPNRCTMRPSPKKSIAAVQMFTTRSISAMACARPASAA